MIRTSEMRPTEHTDDTEFRIFFLCIPCVPWAKFRGIDFVCLVYFVVINPIPL
jgi:hypothetical protein